MHWLKSMKIKQMQKIFKFNPIFKSTIWGGERIAPFKGETTDLTQIGESWEISGVKGNESIVSDGQYAGTPLPELIETLKGSLLGKKVYDRYGKEFPLLIKFIDAAQDLSIQVHPDDELARKRHDSMGKTEMWYVVDAAPGATLLSGFKAKISKDEYVESVEDGSVADKLMRHDVRPGDVFYLPAGRIHSIGAGAFVAEIQETSDITYRIFDFNRRDAAGNLRELHTEQAVDAIDYSVEENYRTDYDLKANQPTPLVSCSHFTTDLLKLTQPVEIDREKIDSFTIAIICEGEVEVSVDGESRKCRRGESILIAADAESLKISPLGGEAQVILTHI